MKYYRLSGNNDKHLYIKITYINMYMYTYLYIVYNGIHICIIHLTLGN